VYCTDYFYPKGKLTENSMKNTFTVYALLYGDYPNLARQLLAGFQPSDFVKEYRIGLNEVSDATRAQLRDWIDTMPERKPVRLFYSSDGRNLAKYPLLRQMLRLDDTSEAVMWFDDDSHVDEIDNHLWWERAARIWKSRASDVVQFGAVHLIQQRKNQFLAVRQQPWFTGKEIGPSHKYTFATGGWWMADRGFLRKWDYPFRELYHNGGDSILGELIRQQGKRIASSVSLSVCWCESCSRRYIERPGPLVHINEGGRKGRRGIGVTGERYVWSDGNPHPDLSHQNFELEIEEYVP
jgi:hypothetical protein